MNNILFENVFNNEELEIIENDLSIKMDEQGWYDWSKIRKQSVEDYGYGSTQWKPVSEKVKLIVRKKLYKFIPSSRENDFNATYSVFDTYSGIHLHSDSNTPYVATFYLNKEWNIDCGGYFVYWCDNEYKLYVPKYNTMIGYSIHDKMPHLVTPATENAPTKRLTIHCKGIIPNY